MKSKNRDIIVIGFALFAIFFGAGNLIFPPTLGNLSGTKWYIAMAGFLSTDPVLPILGIIATAFVGGRPEDLGKRVSPKFAIILSSIAMLLIGPIFSVPRTAATTFEIAIKPYVSAQFTTLAMVITSLVFFAITYYFVINEGKVIDTIGRFLTPALLVVLAIIVVKCIITPIGPIVDTNIKNPYYMGFTEGYQTMDALGSALMCGVVLTNLARSGYKSEKEIKSTIIKVGLVAGILLSLVYGGLTFVGSTTSLTPSSDRVLLLLYIVENQFGSFGGLIMGLSVTLACLTTSIGLTATAGNFFNYAFNRKISYKTVVSISVIVSTLLSLLSVSGIINLAVPILSIIFPIMIVLIILTLFDKYIKYDLSYVGPVLITGIIGTIDTLNSSLGIFDSLNKIIEKLPFAQSGFPWIVPAIIFLIIFTVLGFVLDNNK